MNPSQTRVITTPLGRVAQTALGKMLQPRPARSEDVEVSYLRAGLLGEMPEAEDLPKMYAAPWEIDAYAVLAGELLVAEGGDVGRAEFAPPVPTPTIIQNSLHRVRTETGDIRFLRYSLLAIKASGWLDVLVNRSTFGHLTVEKLRSLRLTWPPASDQRAIADFLDSETTRIDALVAKRSRLLQLLDERWRSLVDRVTHLGTPIRVRHLTSLITSGPRGWADRMRDSGDPFIRSANLRRDGIELRLDDVARVEAPDNPEAERSRLHRGDILMGITGANTGWVGLVTPQVSGGFVSQHVAILRPADISPRWLAFSLFSHRIQDDLEARQYGGTKQQLGLQDLAELVVHVPSDSDQEELGKMLDEQDHRRAEMMSRMSLQIDLLAERRQALITAAMMGKLDVASSIAEEAS